MAKKDARIDKRKVTMSNYVTVVDADGQPQIQKHEATDYVNPELLDLYVADAKTRWQNVQVSEEPEAGPGGYNGETNIPVDLNHPEAGTKRPATKE